MTDLTLNVSKVIDANIEGVFKAWLSPKTLAKFILPMPGMPAPEVKNDPQVGGRFSIIMQVGENKIPHTGKYIEIDRFNKIVFTWESPFSPDDSTVTLLFTEISDKQTKLELNHLKFIDEEARSNHEGGWGNILEQLALISI